MILLYKKITKLLHVQKTIIKNFSFLSILQIVQLLAGLLFFPYLLKVLGSEKYGIIIYAQTIIGYVLLIVNYGFNITATKYVSEFKNDNNQLSLILSTVIVIKIMFYIISSSILFILVYNLDFMNVETDIYIYSNLIVIGWIFFPDWYFQGIEKMQFITYIMIVIKFVSYILIFIYVNNGDDYFLVPVFNSTGMIIGGLFGFILIFKMNSNIRFFMPTLPSIKTYIISGFSFFISNISANSKDYVSTLVLGSVLSYSHVAMYDIVSKVVKVFIMPFNVLARSVFPQCSLRKSFSFNKKIGHGMFIFGLLSSLFIVVYSENIIGLFVSEDIEMASDILNLMCLSLPFLGLNSAYGLLTLVGFNFDVYFTKSTIISILCYFITLLVFFYSGNISVYSLSALLVFSVIIELLLNIYYVNINNIPDNYE